MSVATVKHARPALDVPPVYRPMRLDRAAEVFSVACTAARDGATGTLVYADRGSAIAWAVVLAPEEPMRAARRTFFVGMNALAAAVASQAPPGKALEFAWPDVLDFDGARLAGGRLGWPDGCAEDDVPDWLVFSAALIASKGYAGEPGATPDSTSLEEEGFAADCGSSIVESFARHLLSEFDLWSECGFGLIALRYGGLLAARPGVDYAIDESGDALVMFASRAPERLALVPALRTTAWLDPRTGGPRL